MAPTPYFFLGAATEDTPAAEADSSANAVAPDHLDAVARVGLRRQAASGPGRQQAASRGGGGGAPPRKIPKRGPGVAELERLRCGGGGPPPKRPPNPLRGLSVEELERLRCGGDDPLHDINATAAAANLQAQGNSVVLQQHDDYLHSFDAATGSRYYSPLDPAATMTAARKETAGEGIVAAERRKEVREIEFFPTRVTSHGGPDESEQPRTPPSSSSPPGGVGGSLDLSLRL